VGVDVDLDWRVHPDHAQASDDLRRVGDLLRAQEQLAGVVLPAVVEAFEAVRRESDGSGGREIEMSTVEEIEE